MTHNEFKEFVTEKLNREIYNATARKMNLEKIVTSLDLSLKLKEVGVKQKSMFH